MSRNNTKYYNIRVLLWESEAFDFGQKSKAKKGNYFLKLPMTFLRSIQFQDLTNNEFRLVIEMLTMCSETNRSVIRMSSNGIRRVLGSNRIDIERTLKRIRDLQVIENAQQNFTEVEVEIEKEVDIELDSKIKEKVVVKKNKKISLIFIRVKELSDF